MISPRYRKSQLLFANTSPVMTTPFANVVNAFDFEMETEHDESGGAGRSSKVSDDKNYQARKVRKISLTDSDLYNELWCDAVSQNRTLQHMHILAPSTPTLKRSTPESVFSRSLFADEVDDEELPSPVQPRALWSNNSVDSLATNLFRKPQRNRASSKHNLHSSSTQIICDKRELFLSREILMLGSWQTIGQCPQIHQQFETLGLVGQGMFSEVFQLSSRIHPEQHVALKKSKKCFKNTKELERSVEEMKVLSDLYQYYRTQQSKHTIPAPSYALEFYCGWKEDGYAHMLLEYAPYGTLHDMINYAYQQYRPIPETYIYQMIHDICQSLVTLHDLGYVHLDIKPSNLLIAKNEIVKIGDFGLASKIGKMSLEPQGDARYMAKELLNDTILHPSADIYSLGITFYEILKVNKQIMQISASATTTTNCSMFTLPLEGDAWHQLRDGRISSCQPHCSTSLEQLLCSMMRPLPQDRISAKEILQLPQIAMYNILPPSSTNITGTATCCSTRQSYGLQPIIPKPWLNRSNSFDALSEISC